MLQLVEETRSVGPSERCRGGHSSSRGCQLGTLFLCLLPHKPRDDSEVTSPFFKMKGLKRHTGDLRGWD